MLKEPRPGRVKTRLGRTIGMVPAAWWFRRQTAQLIRRMRSAEWELVLAVSPDREGQISRIWPPDLPRWPQGSGDLGHRMRRVFQRLPPGPVVIIGADVPAIRQHHIRAAFAALGASDYVMGPAPDGGYWLIGMHRTCSFPASGFGGVRWSTAHAYADTVRSFGDLRLAVVESLSDVDDAGDL